MLFALITFQIPNERRRFLSVFAVRLDGSDPTAPGIRNFRNSTGSWFFLRVKRRVQLSKICYGAIWPWE